MAFIEIINKYHLGLNGIGLILQGAPDKPAYEQIQAPLYGQRFASGDRSYNDLSKWWYFAQTDWSGGFKDSQPWEDDAKYYFSTNVDTLMEAGGVKLALGLASDNDFSEEIYQGSYEAIGATNFKYIGTKDNAGDSKPRLYRYSGGSWSNIISAYIPTSAEWIADQIGHKGLLYVITVGTTAATTFAVFSCAADGSSQTDHTAAIATALTLTVSSGTAVVSDDNTIYVAVSDAGAGSGIVKSTDNGATWTQVVKFGYEAPIVSMAIFGGDLYYIVEKSNGYDFRKFSVASSVDLSVNFFFATFTTITGGATASRRMLRVFQGSLIMTLPDKEIWKYTTGGVLTRLLKRDEFKFTDLTAIRGESSWVNSLPGSHEYKGCIEHDNKLWWGNLTWDGISFANTIKDNAGTVNNWAFPLFSDGTLMYWTDSVDKSILWKDSGYKTLGYVVLNNFDIVSGVDKIAYSVNAIFKPLASGQSITIEYLLGELTGSSVWNNLLVASFASDGGVIGSKKIFFNSGTTKLSGTHTAGATTINVDSTDSFPASGTIRIGTEEITYTGITSTSFTGATRGANGTTAAAYADDVVVTNITNVIFSKIWFRVKLTGGGTTTPTLRDIVMEYLPVPSQTKAWNINVNCSDTIHRLDGALNPFTGRQVRSMLDQAWWTKEILDFQDMDYASTTVDPSFPVGASDTTITVAATQDFPERGRIRIEDEEIFYRSKTPTSFVGCVRGRRDTRAVAHPVNVAVTNAYKVIITNYSSKIPIALKDRELEYIVGVSLREV